jgi:hypothetical protein
MALILSRAEQKWVLAEVKQLLTNPYALNPSYRQQFVDITIDRFYLQFPLRHPGNTSVRAEGEKNAFTLQEDQLLMEVSHSTAQSFAVADHQFSSISGQHGNTVRFLHVSGYTPLHAWM